MADHEDRIGAGSIVVRIEQPSAAGADPERCEVVAGHELPGDRLGDRGAGAANAHRLAGRLECGKRRQFRKLVPQMAVRAKREQCIVVLETAVDAAVVVVAKADELAGPRDGQALIHRRPNKREDRHVRPEAQGQRDNRDRAEPGTLDQAADGEAQIGRERIGKHGLFDGGVCRSVVRRVPPAARVARAPANRSEGPAALNALVPRHRF